VIPELVAAAHLVRLVRNRLAAARHDERGYSAEAVIVTAVLVALALVALGIIAAKVIGKANSISTS
jgi:hypothetical protein